MSTRKSGGADGGVYTELPRSSELTPAPETVQEPTEPRAGHGHFGHGNKAAAGPKWRALMKRGLGRDLQGGAGELGRRAARFYAAFLRDLPCACASVCSLVVERARAAALADFYAELGLKLGPHTDKGMAYLAEARLWGARAERLSVTTWDLSTRAAKVAKARPIDVHAEVAEAFGGGDDA